MEEPQQNNEPEAMSCEVFLTRVMMSLDGALSREEEERLCAEVRKHPECLEQINILRCYKVFLSQKLKRHNTSSELKDAILKKIRDAQVEA